MGNGMIRTKLDTPLAGLDAVDVLNHSTQYFECGHMNLKERAAKSEPASIKLSA